MNCLESFLFFNSDKLLCEKLADPVKMVNSLVELEADLAGSEDTLGLSDALVQNDEISSSELFYPVFVFNITTIMAKYGYNSQDGQRRLRNSNQVEIVEELEQLPDVVADVRIHPGKDI